MLGQLQSRSRPRRVSIGRSNQRLSNGGKIIGGLTFGEDANIGANAVILSDLPPGTTAVDMSANILKFTTAQEND
jgi:serine acetyltransferase